MSKIVDVVNSLSELLPLKPASDTQITDAELQLRVSFSDEYKEYLSSFGAIMADGIELSGIAKSDYRNVVFLTKREWDLNPNVPHTMYVVEDTHIDGIIIWQSIDGAIYETHPDSEPVKLAGSLSDYIVQKK